MLFHKPPPGTVNGPGFGGKTNKMSKRRVLKKLQTIQGKVMELWQELGTSQGTHCQIITRELAELEKKIERGSIKIKTK